MFEETTFERKYNVGPNHNRTLELSILGERTGGNENKSEYQQL